MVRVNSTLATASEVYMRAELNDRRWLLTSVLCLGLLAVGSLAHAQVAHNAPTKFGATFYFWRDVYKSLPRENIYTPKLDWNVDRQAWWDYVVAAGRSAGLGWLAVNAFGQGSSSDPGFVPPGGSSGLSELKLAIDRSDGQMKLALFDDTTSEVLRKNKALYNKWCLPDDASCPGAPRFDLADINGTGDGGWYYFWDQQWKRFFDAVPAEKRFTINGRPVVFMWHGGYEWYSNTWAFSNLIDALRAACLVEYNFDPFVIVEDSWLLIDADVQADATYDWFEPAVQKWATVGSHNGITVGHTVPG
jgi:hypothetical protein